MMFMLQFHELLCNHHIFEIIGYQTPDSKYDILFGSIFCAKKFAQK
jgi:hypothetical protein